MLEQIDGHQLEKRLGHTHVLRYCMQHSTVGYVSIESEHCICKVSV